MSERRPAVYDILEELSNEEIRRRIVFYGGPNLPVTDQTRGRLLDVLREYIDQSKQHRRPKESKSCETNAPKTCGNDSNLNDAVRPSASASAASVYEEQIPIQEVFPSRFIVYSTVTVMLSFLVYYAMSNYM